MATETKKSSGRSKASGTKSSGSRRSSASGSSSSQTQSGTKETAGILRALIAGDLNEDTSRQKAMAALDKIAGPPESHGKAE